MTIDAERIPLNATWFPCCGVTRRVAAYERQPLASRTQRVGLIYLILNAYWQALDFELPPIDQDP